MIYVHALIKTNIGFDRGYCQMSCALSYVIVGWKHNFGIQKSQSEALRPKLASYFI